MPAPIPQQRSAQTRLGGLDGLRAIAVGLVMVYHLFPTLLPGGFLGVDVFFAISGFLITSLLLRELDTSGRIGLADFWRRRARRLLPALALVLLVSTSFALIVGGDILVNVGAQLAGAAFFVSNWMYIAMGSDYFTRDNPELFRNTWSLSIEEQFYIVLPLLLLLLFWLFRRIPFFRARVRSSRSLVLLTLGAASAIWMVVLSVLGADPTRIYFGSDSHIFGLFLGAAAASFMQRTPANDAAPSPQPLPDPTPATRGRRAWRQIGLTACAVAGLAVLGWCAVTLQEGSAASFIGGFQLATVAAIGVVWAVTRPGAWIGHVLDVAPLRWVGERSYGLYLWHWPLLVIATHAWGSQVQPWLVSIIALAMTVVCAMLSYRYVEQPIRRLGLLTAIRRLFTFSIEGRRSRIIAASVSAVLVVTAAATGYAIATAPTMSTAAEAIARGQAALEARNAAQAELDAAEAEASSARPNGDAEASGPEKQTPDSPVTFEGRDITAIGDSVMLASLPELTEALPDISVDAAVSRGFTAGVDLTSAAADQSSLRSVVVAGLGTNGPVEIADLERLRQIAGTRPLVLVNAYGERDWIPVVNQTLTDFAAAYPGVVVADWAGSVNGVPDALAGDGIHPNTSGGVIYAEAVGRALEELQTPDESIGYALPRR